MRFVQLSRTSLRVCYKYCSWNSKPWTILLDTRSITEPAGALALAGLKRYILQNNLVGAQKKFVAVVSGANMNFDRLRFVAERAELGEGREAMLSVDIAERPGRWALHHHILFCSVSFTCILVLSHYILLFTLELSRNSSIGTTVPATEPMFCSLSSSRPQTEKTKFSTYCLHLKNRICKGSTLAMTRWLRVT